MSSLNFSSQNQRCLSGLLLGGLMLGLAASPAQASGPVEAWTGVSLDPENAQRLMLRYDNTGTKTGLVYSEDGGKNFSLVCTSAMAEDAIRALQAPSTARIADLRSSLMRARKAVFVGEGRTLIGSTAGLLLDDGTGCGFRDVPELSELWISGLTTATYASNVSYALTNGATDSEREGLWRRGADGTFTQLWHSLTAPEGENWSNAGLLVGEKPGGGPRIVTMISRSWQDATSKQYLYTVSAMRSDDGGATFEEREVEVPERAGFNLLAIDPTDGNRVLAMFERTREGGTLDENRDSLLLSSDGGLTYQPLYDEITSLASAVFAPDGTLWVADAGEPSGKAGFPSGLLRFEKGLVSPPQRVLSGESVGCVAVQSDEALLLCKPRAFGRYELAKKTFTQWVEMLTVQTIHSCKQQDLVADCHDQLCSPGWCGPGHFAAAPLCSAYDETFCGNNADNYNDPVPQPDAGTSGDGDADDPDAGAPVDGGQSAPRAQKDSSCSLQPMANSRGLGPSAWSVSMLLGALLLRRRSRRAEARGVASGQHKECV